MIVKDIMTTEFVSLSPKTHFFEAAKLLLDHHVSGAPVIDDTGTLVGVLSEKDLFRALYPSYKEFYLQPDQYISHEGLRESLSDAMDKSVEQIMSKRLITTHPGGSILKIGGLMVATGIHRVPVVKDEKVVGMVSRGDVYRAILQQDFNLYSELD
ncbi:CBS domain-containing protein [Candidatus Nomurabacteria bacterium]|nr:CBS domain-containing protein [Candidatus Nomurabacteria bacterium]